MAAIASLLGIVDLKKADGIVLATGQVPTLLIGGGRSPLTMPPMSASMLESALAELLTPELRAALGAAGHVETRHTSGDRGTFNVRVRVEDGTTTVTLEKGDGSNAAEPPAARPAAQPAVTARSDDHEPAPVAAALDHALSRRGSDVLLSTGLRPRVRVEGEWVEVEAPPVTAADLEQAFVSRLAEERRRSLEQTGSVDITRCPVSAAVSASRIVSGSRISPTRMMSGLSRSAARSPAAKLLTWAPISRWWMTARSRRKRYSTGSSRVTMWQARVWLT